MTQGDLLYVISVWPFICIGGMGIVGDGMMPDKQQHHARYAE